jgi:hypothetical protein
MSSLRFDFPLYTTQDPYFRDAPDCSEFQSEMPSRQFWEANARRFATSFDISHPPYALYSDDDPYYSSTEMISPYRSSMPTFEYWVGIVDRLRTSRPDVRAESFVLDPVKAELLADIVRRTTPTLLAPPGEIPHSQTVEFISATPIVGFSIGDITVGRKRDLGELLLPVELAERLSIARDLLQRQAEGAIAAARVLANPYESIGSAGFMNQEAVVLANIDALFNLTNSPDFGIRPASDYESGTRFYFADICGGPGGWTDYLTWRLAGRGQGFGRTLRGPQDWMALHRFRAPPTGFRPHYGDDGPDRKGTGTVLNLRNLALFEMIIAEATSDQMVNLAVADGDGPDDAKRIILAECICGLSVLRPGGNFVCKVFDLVSEFAVGLIFVVAQCFARFAIVKPHSSRPTSSERYCVFIRLRERSPPVISLLAHAADRFANLPEGAEIASIFPMDRIPESFREYILASNTEIVTRQLAAIEAVLCLANMGGDQRSAVPTIDREDVRMRCLAEWRLLKNPTEVKGNSQQVVDTAVLELDTVAGWTDEETEKSELGGIIAKYAVVDPSRERLWIERPIIRSERLVISPTYFTFGD